MNWIVSLLSFPNMTIEMRDDKTNIQANEQTKIAKSACAFISEAKIGMELPKVVKADRVKIW
jgi:hypothetical protein